MENLKKELGEIKASLVKEDGTPKNEECLRVITKMNEVIEWVEAGKDLSRFGEETINL